MKNKIQFGLVGKGIGYSFSRKYFSKKFNSNVSFSRFTYENFDIDSINKIDKIFLNQNIAGLNVTIPYKESIIKFLDVLSDEAKEIGSVNTICFNNKKRIGYNTDIFGFSESLKLDLDNNFDRVLILGSGGVSKTIKYYCAKNDIPYQIVSRKTDNSFIKYIDLDTSNFKGSVLIVNCTPLGTYPNINDCPQIPYDLLSKKNILFDLVYNPSETLFMKMGKKIGCKTLNGYNMLKRQADKSLDLWLKHIK